LFYDALKLVNCPLFFHGPLIKSAEGGGTDPIGGYLHAMENTSLLKRISFMVMVGFYLFAGYNHFADPGFYEPLIPPYLSAWKSTINSLSGIAEILLALLLILMLLAFIPAHVYFIQKGSFAFGPFTMTPAIAWTRLLVIHPLLIGWAWWAGRQ
jgi:uncharacterized membrane protein